MSPNSCSSNTYVVVLPSEGSLTEEQANNVICYIKTKFFRFLVSTKTSTQDMPPKAYEFVPLQDFSKKWTDPLLYKKYGLSQQEIQVIENSIPTMD